MDLRIVALGKNGDGTFKLVLEGERERRAFPLLSRRELEDKLKEFTPIRPCDIDERLGLADDTDYVVVEIEGWKNYLESRS